MRLETLFTGSSLSTAVSGRCWPLAPDPWPLSERSEDLVPSAPPSHRIPISFRLPSAQPTTSSMASNPATPTGRGFLQEKTRAACTSRSSSSGRGRWPLHSTPRPASPGYTTSADLSASGGFSILDSRTVLAPSPGDVSPAFPGGEEVRRRRRIPFCLAPAGAVAHGSGLLVLRDRSGTTVPHSLCCQTTGDTRSAIG